MTVLWAQWGGALPPGNQAPAAWACGGLSWSPGTQASGVQSGHRPGWGLGRQAGPRSKWVMCPHVPWAFVTHHFQAPSLWGAAPLTAPAGGAAFSGHILW